MLISQITSKFTTKLFKPGSLNLTSILFDKNVFKRLNSTTIFALASGSNQRCGVAVVRLSGNKSINVLSEMTKSKKKFEPRKMYLRNIWHPVTKNKIDKSLVVLFKEPKSFTGEDIVEFHVHGGPAVISSLLNALSSFDGLRYAEPGEFSKRAFVNGQMDLTEIEGLLDLVNAETELQRQQALSQMEGSLSKLYKNWRENIVKCLANVEAYIDFSEEENVEDDVLEQVEKKVKELIDSIEKHLNDNRKGERLRNGVRVAIIGKPNAGKSSLLNSLCKRPAAIVSPIPGTTRDVVESAINIDGYPIVLSDTAGLRRTDDLIEKEGVKRALERVESADIIVIVIDLKESYEQISKFGMEKFIENHLRNLDIKNSYLLTGDALSHKKVIVSLNKKDLLDGKQLENLKEIVTKFDQNKHIFINQISCIDNNDCLNNIDEFLKQLSNILKNLCWNSIDEMPSLTSSRHRDNLIKCLNNLKEYLNKYQNQQFDDYAITSEELRQAVRWLGVITGHITSEQILDVIFRDFCIGK